MMSGLSTRGRVVLGLVLSGAVLSQGHVELVSGKNGNCSSLWGIGSASATIGRRTRMLTCTGGDQACDADGLSNGVCVINLNVCVGETAAS
jgi:hypothetical protein